MSDNLSKEQTSAEELQSEQNADELAQDSETNDESPDQSAGLERELADAQDKYLRLAAEFENFKKRNSRERSELINSANDLLIMQLLDVVDNFDRALQQTEQTVKQKNVDKEKLFHSLHDGARMIHEQLKRMLESHGVEEIQAEGALFDPELHEATLQIETTETEPDYVAQVISKGYKKGKRILRHAKVGVAKPESKSKKD